MSAAALAPNYRSGIEREGDPERVSVFLGLQQADDGSRTRDLRLGKPKQGIWFP